MIGTGSIEFINSTGDRGMTAPSSMCSTEGKNGPVGNIRPYF